MPRRLVRLTALLFAFAVTAVPAVASAPSFALWTAKWNAYSDKVTNAAADPCQKLFPTDDLKLGECFVKRELAAYRNASPLWERQVAQIARGQTAACRVAIHAYWLASEKNQKAAIIFFSTHPHTSITDIDNDVKQPPYSTLQSLTNAAKAHAIRVCG